MACTLAPEGGCSAGAEVVNAAQVMWTSLTSAVSLSTMFVELRYANCRMYGGQGYGTSACVESAGCT